MRFNTNDDDSLCPDCSLMGGDRVCKYCHKLNQPHAALPLPEDSKIESGVDESEEIRPRTTRTT
jgi:hypothetical protein